MVPTLTPGGKTWIYDKNRVLLGWEALRLQGFPVTLIDSSYEQPSDPMMGDLAGNAFSATVVLAVTLGVLCHIGKLRAAPPLPTSHDNDEEISVAVGLLAAAAE
eukprot:5831177-Heterocapsa_arctica.AAC.1